MSDFEARYEYADRVLGEGLSGPVRLFRDRRTKQNVAVKTLVLNNIPPARQAMLKSEVDIYLKLSHPNIVNLLGVYEDPHHKINLVMEVCTGGELYDRLARKERYSELTAARVTKQMLEAVAYLHRQSIVHRDIKLENWLYQHEGDDSAIKLCDFGFGSFVYPGIFLTATLGSVHYVAPEVLAGEYGLSCDVWSVGVIVYMLLSGGPPFDGPNDKTIIQQIKTGEFSLAGRRWENISESAKKFIRSLLKVDPSQRLTADAALEHPWLSLVHAYSSSQSLTDMWEGADSPKLGAQEAIAGVPVPQAMRNEAATSFTVPTRKRPVIDRQVVEQMHAFASNAAVQKTALGILISTVNHSQLSDIAKEFQSKDRGNTGRITVADFIGVLEKVVHFEPCETGFSSTGKSGALINYRELLAATASPRISRVHSGPSEPTSVFQPRGWYRLHLRPFYDSFPISNLLKGIIFGESPYVRDALSRGLVGWFRLGQEDKPGSRADYEDSSIGQSRDHFTMTGLDEVDTGSPEEAISGPSLGGMFIMPNPKFHLHPRDLPSPGKVQSIRFVVWWIPEEFVYEVESWMKEALPPTLSNKRRQEGSGYPGDFGFSSIPKPLHYLHTYRDLSGESGIRIVEQLVKNSQCFLSEKFCSEFLNDSKISMGFHFPVRTQYSTLHMQIRINSGSVVGSDGRGISASDVVTALQEDPDLFVKDGVDLRYRVTENVRANLAAAGAGALYGSSKLGTIASAINLLLTDPEDSFITKHSEGE